MSARLGILVSHPIQYHSPWFRHLAGRVDLQVLYAHRQTARGQGEAGFDVAFEWDVDLLDGYPHRFLDNVAPRPGVDSFGGCDTPEIREIIRSGRFDALLVFGWNRKSALQAIVACWREGVPVLMRGDSHLDLPRGRAVELLKRVPYRWFLPRMDGHLYVGVRNRAYLEHYGVPAERLFFAPHFVDVARFRRDAEAARRDGSAERLRSRLGIEPGAFVFLFAGKLLAGKRAHDFLEAFRRFRRTEEGRSAHALVVGDGPERSRLEGMGEARIHFAGFQNQSVMPSCYAMTDALVLPSESESWGLVVNEAFACGVPAIVSDAVGCAPDLMEEGRTGFVFPMGDVERLSARMGDIVRLQRSRAGRVREAVAARTAAHSMEEATRGLEAALDHVVPRARAAAREAARVGNAAPGAVR